METLNTIEKMTLLVSTGIVFLANLFVMLENAKKSAKQNGINVIQKLMGLKNTFFVLVLMIVMSSCSGSKFLDRKYTTGRYSQHARTLKHNTIYADTTKSYVSINQQLELKASSTVLDNYFEKERAGLEVSSIIKKDSIFITKRKGRDKKVIKRDKFEKTTIVNIMPAALSIDNLPELEKEYYQKTNTATIIIKRKGKDRYVAISERGDTIECKNLKPIYKIKDEELKRLTVNACNKLSYKAMGWSILSFAGLALSISALCKIRKAKRKYENINLKEAKTVAFISLVISLLTTLCFLAITVYVLNYLASGIGAAATAGR